jgi:hypothetical protein
MSQASSDRAQLPFLKEFAMTLPGFQHRKCGVV